MKLKEIDNCILNFLKTKSPADRTDLGRWRLLRKRTAEQITFSLEILERFGFIEKEESEKVVGRPRQIFKITELGLKYLEQKNEMDS